MADDDDIEFLDPDRDDVPEELLEHQGQPVFMLDEDGVADGTLVVFPELLKLRRRSEPSTGFDEA
jgi:hypothetical protein